MNWSLLQNSLLVAGLTTALAVAFGLMGALWLATLRAGWRTLFLGLAIMALALPPFLVTNSWLDLFADSGWLHSWLPLKIYSLPGTIWTLSLMFWPISLFAALSAWQRLEAAQLECEPAMTGSLLLRYLLLPAACGELALASVLTFVLALNNFAVPAILQTKVLPDEMWVRFNTQFDTFGALKLSLPLIIAPVLLLLWASRRGVAWPRIKGTISPAIFQRQLGSTWRTGSGIALVALCALSVGLPLAQIVFAKRTWTELSGAIEATISPIWNSFWFAALAATVIVGLGIMVSTICFRRRENSSFQVSSALLRLVPWLFFFIPGVLLGIALINIFNRPVLAAFYQSAAIVLLAFIVRYFALGHTAARHAVESVDSDLTDAAQLEGASGWQSFRHVLWPQITPQMFAAWYVVYLLCLWDVESIVLVQPPGGETLALKIFNLLHYGHAAQVNALCVALLLVALGPLVLWQLTSTLKKTFCTSRCAWALVVGVLFVAGCVPQDDSHVRRLESRIFERAQIIGSRGVGIGEFNKTRSVAVDAQDNVYAVDMTGRVQKFSPEGKYLLSWQMPQTDLGKPKGMGRDRDGNIIVVEPHYQRVNHFTTDGKLVGQWGCRGTNEGCFMLPRAIAVNSHGEMFVSEYMGEERVQRFKVAGQGRDAKVELVGIIGKAGTGPGEFNRAEGVCVDAQDRLYVADSCNHRIQIFSPEGKFIREFGKPGSRLGELSYPYDVTVDPDGNIYVCEFGNSRIQIFDPNCQPIEIVGRPGPAPGEFNNPWGIALDSHGNLYVADALNHRVQKLTRRVGRLGRVAHNQT